MAALEDPLTGDFPTRTVLEEDEELAEPLNSRYFTQPEYEWQLPRPDVVNKLLVFVGPAAAIIADSVFADAQLLGMASCQNSACNPLTTKDNDEFGGEHVKITCSLNDAESSQQVLARFGEAPPDEQASTIARSLLCTLRPESVIVVTTFSPRDIHLWESEGFHASEQEDDVLVRTDAPVFGLTSGGASLEVSGQVQPAPPGLLLSGLGAALLTRGTMQDLPTLGLLGLQTGQAPDVTLCTALAKSLWSMLRCSTESCSREMLKRIAAACDARYQGSAASTLFA